MQSLFEINPWLVIAVVALVSFVIGRLSVGDTTARLRRREAARADLQVRFADLDSTSRSEIQGIMASGQKISAIKRLRELTGCGLKDAKDFVESLER